jgi:hypothetical protein
MTGFIVAFLSVCMSDISIIIYLLGNHNYREILSSIYHLSKPIYYIIFIIGFMTPAFIVNYISNKIDRYRLSRKQRMEQSNDMIHLHNRITSLAPKVCLPTDDYEIHKSRLVVEISDARDYLWSQEPHSREYITPKDDFKKIIALETKGIVLLEMGKYTPPSLKNSPMKHNLAVARMLKKHPKPIHTIRSTELETIESH